ncbi:hypothetical protein Hte_004547 [Hypoxylon texense]
MIGLALAMFTNNLDATIIATAIPYITDEFHTIQDVGWYVSSTFLTSTSFQSTWGKAYKYLPLKPSVSAITLFFQIIGVSFCVTGAQAAFSTVLVRRAPIYVPGIDASSLINAGATELRSVFPPEQIPGIVQAYMDALRVAFAFAIALFGISFLFTLVPKWDDLRPSAVQQNKEPSSRRNW